MAQYATTLSIAGSDSCGGAGIQADLKTFSALGTYGMTAITAVTAQNTTGVSSIMPVSPQVVADQIDAVFSDIRPDAVKIGMLMNSQIIMAVADCLQRWKPRHIVLDPVMIATSGSRMHCRRWHKHLRCSQRKGCRPIHIGSRCKGRANQRRTH